MAQKQTSISKTKSCSIVNSIYLLSGLLCFFSLFGTRAEGAKVEPPVACTVFGRRFNALSDGEQRNIVAGIQRRCATDPSDDCLAQALNELMDRRFSTHPESGIPRLTEGKKDVRPTYINGRKQASAADPAPTDEELLSFAKPADQPGEIRSVADQLDTPVSATGNPVADLAGARPKPAPRPPAAKLKLETLKPNPQVNYTEIDSDRFPSFEARFDPVSGRLKRIDTSTARTSTHHSDVIDNYHGGIGEKTELALWVSTEDGRRYIVTDPRLSKTSIGSLGRGKPIRAGGQTEIIQGRVVRINNRTEPYYPRSDDNLLAEVNRIKNEMANVVEEKVITGRGKNGLTEKRTIKMQPHITTEKFERVTPNGEPYTEYVLHYEYRVPVGEIPYHTK